MGTKNEMSDVKEIPKTFEIESTYTIVLCGKVINKSVEGKCVVLSDSANGLLDLDNIIFDANKIPIGFIDDVVGKVDNPFYIVKFLPSYTGNTDLSGHSIYYVKEKAKFVNKVELIQQKGCDASNAFDEEIDLDEEDFSDDDQETAIKQIKRNRRNQNNPNHNQRRNEKNNKHTNNNSNIYSNNSQYNQRCPEYILNANTQGNFFMPQTMNQNAFVFNPYANYAQQQYYQNNATLFNPNSMFSPYSSSNINQQNQVQNNQPYLQRVNPFASQNTNQK